MHQADAGAGTAVIDASLGPHAPGPWPQLQGWQQGLQLTDELRWGRELLWELHSHASSVATTQRRVVNVPQLGECCGWRLLRQQLVEGVQVVSPVLGFQGWHVAQALEVDKQLNQLILPVVS